MVEESSPPAKKGWYKFIGSKDEADKDVKANDIWKGFKERTTAHGVPHVDKASGFCKVTFWTLVSLACLAMLTFHTQYISAYFWDWRVDVVVKLAHKRELTFPSVTLCNTNPLKLSSVVNNPDLNALLSPTVSGRKRRSIAEGMAINCHETDHPNSKYCHRHSRKKRSVTSSFYTEDKVMEILAGLTEAERTALGYNVSEIIMDCRYAGSNCKIHKMTQFFDPIQGNCFSFNSGWDSSTRIESSKRAGRRHGLHLVINIHQEQYVDELAQGAGLRVVIHPQERMPFPSDEGILATPGKLTSVGIRQVHITRLDGKYGNCSFVHGNNSARNVFEQYYPVYYSANACFKTCYQKYVIERCNCADPQYPTSGVAFGNTHTPICQIDNVDNSTCKAQVSSEYQNNELECECPVLCNETAYNFEVSSVEWPSNINENSILSQFSSQIPEIIASNDTSKAMRKNLLKLEIYFQEFNYETMDERPAYLPANYLSDIGGILGLWFGCSVLSIFEFIELATDMIVLGCMRCCRKCKQRFKLSREKSDTVDIVRRQSQSSDSQASASSMSRNGQTIYVERRIKKGIPDTPPPPYTSTENLRTATTTNSRNTRFHGLGTETPHDTLKYV